LIVYSFILSPASKTTEVTPIAPQATSLLPKSPLTAKKLSSAALSTPETVPKALQSTSAPPQSTLSVEAVKSPLMKPPASDSSPPKYRNPNLEQIVADRKHSSELALISMNLTDQDMEIVAYYAVRNNQVR
jgi:hypothetical protein